MENVITAADGEQDEQEEPAHRGSIAEAAGRNASEARDKSMATELR